MSPWFVNLNSHDSQDFQLICFPSAGSSASQFKNWVHRMSLPVSLIGCQLPGREERFNHQHITEFSELMDILSIEVQPFIQGRYGILGHSLGALIGYCLIERLLEKKQNAPQFFISCGKEAPQCHTVPTKAELASDIWLINKMKSYNSVPKELLESKEFIEIFIPTIQSDYHLLASYTYNPKKNFPVPLFAFHGNQDTSIQVEKVKNWSKCTDSSFQFQSFEGGHFFVNQNEEEVLKSVNYIISTCL